jgi:hypothetical protein
MKESVKIDPEVLKRVRKWVKYTGQTISGFIGYVLLHRMDELELKKSEKVSGKKK